MLILYDVMLIDNDPVLTKPQRTRRKHLEQLINPIPGRADLVMREEIYFSSPDGPKQLQRTFANGITQRWEGFVLKPCDEPYFTMMEHSRDNYAGRWIKLKKDYIQGLGDTADFAVVGACYDSNTARATGIHNLSWTHFHIACLENKEDVLRFDAKPMFRVVDVVNQCLKNADLETLNQQGRFRGQPYDPSTNYDELEVCVLPALSQRMDVVFREPFVFEIMGSGFDKRSNTDCFTLRFPRVLKIHWDRTFRDAVSVSEFEEMAEQSRNVADDATSQEDAAWIARLEIAERGKRSTLACWENSQASSFNRSSPESSRSESNSPRRTRLAGFSPVVRVDTRDMLPGETRLVSDGAISRSIPQASLVALPTPPASSPEELQALYCNVPSVAGVDHSYINSKKRSAESCSGDQHCMVSKRRKDIATSSYKIRCTPMPSSVSSPNKAPLTEISNISLRRRASPPAKVMKKACDKHEATEAQIPVEQPAIPPVNVPPTPDPTPAEQSQPSTTPSSSQPTTATQDTTSPARPATPQPSATQEITSPSHPATPQLSRAQNPTSPPQPVSPEITTPPPHG